MGPPHTERRSHGCRTRCGTRLHRPRSLPQHCGSAPGPNRFSGPRRDVAAGPVRTCRGFPQSPRGPPHTGPLCGNPRSAARTRRTSVLPVPGRRRGARPPPTDVPGRGMPRRPAAAVARPAHTRTGGSWCSRSQGRARSAQWPARRTDSVCRAWHGLSSPSTVPATGRSPRTRPGAG
ncbi:hypothetical protein ADK52_30930 [Streptomyces sp. WM6372]|nr:hypothetical protein ADK52_30930 [Streptomyces sp. WM6372]